MGILRICQRTFLRVSFAVMQISNLHVRDIENRWESLSLCLQAVARWAGVELQLCSINAALGLSFMVSQVSGV